MLDWLLIDANAKAFLAATAGASAVVAALTFSFNAVKARTDRRQQQSFKAREVWSSYMELAFDYPEFSGGFDYDGSREPLKQEQYEWFVSRMLYACEEAISYAPRDPWWKETLKLQLGYHHKYFCVGHFDEPIKGYSKSLQDLFIEWRNAQCPQPEVSTDA